MMKNKTVVFLLLFVASIAGGMALKNIINSSMIIALGLGMGLLVGAFFSMNK